MSNFENISAIKSPEALVQNFEAKRIDESDGVFDELYEDHQRDINKTNELDARYNPDNQENKLGKVAEALVFSTLTNHEVQEHLEFRPTSRYDDYFHGADLLVEPRNARVQSLASIDITIDQEDIKGLQRRNTEFFTERPVGLEQKILRARGYTDRLANIDSSHARDLFGWINGGGLHEKRTDKNRANFAETERLFLMKYYKSSDTSEEPEKPGFVIGGPQAVISLDSMFVNKALSGDKKASDTIGDLALLEFIMCIQQEQLYLDGMVRAQKSRNIFFDTHYSKVKAWSNVFERPELEELTGTMVQRNQHSQEFREQLKYYAETFSRIRA